MAASELESHSGDKLANSGEITNGYEYSQERFHLKRLLSNVSSLGRMPAQEQEDVHIVHQQMRFQSLQWQPGAACPQTCVAHQGQASLSHLSSSQPFSKLGATSRLHLICI